MSAEWGKGQQRPGAGKPYAQEVERRGPVRRVAMPRAPRLYAPEATVHVVARCNNREFYFTTAEDFATVLGKPRGMVRDYEPTLYAYTVMSNHTHLLPQPRGAGTLAQQMDVVGHH